jgi:ribonuclease-3
MKINYSFKDLDLKKRALTHPSACRENKEESYERLEFLGDKILNFVIADLLWIQYPNTSEAHLSVMHSNLVNTTCLAKIANSIDLGSALHLDASEERNKGRSKSKILENSLEAIIGAIYLDSDLKTVKALIADLWKDSIEDSAMITQRDAKSLLQEWAQKYGKPIPVYKVKNSEGDSHNPIFTIEVNVEGMLPCEAIGSSKKIAQQNAATKMLDIINNE